MEHDTILRWVLVAAFVLFVPVAAYYRIKAHATGEKIDHRQEGWFILLTLRPVAALHYFGLIAYLIDPSWMAWSSVSLPIWLRWFGVLLGVVGATWFIWTMHTLGKNLTDTVYVRKAATLVTTGPYAWVRHPLYVGFTLAFAANSLVTANWLIASAGGLALILVYLRTRIEEAKLTARFGDAYRQYMRTTGRFWPRLRK